MQLSKPKSKKYQTYLQEFNSTINYCIIGY